MCHVPFSIEKIYKSNVGSDIVYIDACHLLLGRFWQFNMNAVHRGRDNVYQFQWNSKKVRLVSLTNKKKNHKAKGQNFLAIVKGHLEEDCDSWEELQKEEEFEVNFIPEEVQPLLVEFADITPLEMPDRLPPL